MQRENKSKTCLGVSLDLKCIKDANILLISFLWNIPFSLEGGCNLIFAHHSNCNKEWCSFASCRSFISIYCLHIRCKLFYRFILNAHLTSAVFFCHCILYYNNFNLDRIQLDFCDTSLIWYWNIYFIQCYKLNTGTS